MTLKGTVLSYGRAGPTGRRERYGLPFWRWGLWGCIFAVGFGVEAAAYTAEVVVESPPGSRGVTAVALIVFFWLLVLSAIRWALCGAYANDHGLRVVNPWRTRSVPWSSMDRVELDDWGPIVDGQARLYLRDGTSVPIRSIGRPNPISERAGRSIADDLVEALNARIRLERGLPSPGP